MPYEIPGLKGSFESAADLSAAGNQFKYVKLDAAGKVIAIAAITDIPIGVLQNNLALGQTAEVMIDGITKLQADQALTPGAIVGTSADGQADIKIPGTDTTEHVNGFVLEGAAAAGNLATVRIVCGFPNRAS